MAGGATGPGPRAIHHIAERIDCSGRHGTPNLHLGDVQAVADHGIGIVSSDALRVAVVRIGGVHRKAVRKRLVRLRGRRETESQLHASIIGRQGVSTHVERLSGARKNLAL